MSPRWRRLCGRDARAPSRPYRDWACRGKIERMSATRRVIATGLPLGLYVASLLLPATGPIWSGDTTTHNGWEAFEVGYGAIIDLEEWFPGRVLLIAGWLANPAIWTAIVCLALGWRRMAAVTASVGCLLTLCVLPDWWQLVVDHPAYWFWWGSSVAALLCALFLLPRTPQPFVEDYRPMSRATLTPDS